MKPPRSIAAILGVLAFTVSGHAAPANRETFNAFAVDLGSSGRRSSTSHVKVTVDRWSTEEERRRLVSVFTESGEDAFLKELATMKPVGRISTPDSLGYDLRYAHQIPLASGGRRILIATDRPMTYWERANHPRSADYPFTVVEMRLDASGKGQGKMTLATRVNAFGDVIELENYDLSPVHLTNIQASRK
jgi:hypothetical protein